jgi:hypothetical protein
MKRLVAITLLLMFAQCVAVAADPPKPERFARRWIYSNPGFDLRKDDHAERLLALIARAKQAGYNGLTVRTGRLAKFEYLPPAVYYRNAERVRKAAEAANIELIPLAMRINGYSNGTLANNPNLAEGMPVRDCVLEVQEGQPRVAESENLLPFGDFEAFSISNRPDGWSFVDAPGKVSFEDRDVRHSGAASLRMENFATGSEHGNGRVFKKLILKPWHQYHVKVWVKTENVKSPGMIWVRAHGDVSQRKRFNLHRAHWDVRPTQDWKLHHAVFNAQHNGEVWLYIGGWQPGSGKMWLDDISLQEVAGINLLRREGCPIRVTSEDGSVEYEEGRDFQRWEYPQMGRVRWPGFYAVAHPEPPIVLTEQSRIRDGQNLKVSFYHAVDHFGGGGMHACLSHDEVFDCLERHLKLVKKVWQPRTYFMIQDEIRLAGWCELCNRPGVTTGQLLAECTHRCTDIIRRVDPGAEIVNWSDMFDPNHNAVDNYWLTRGTMKGSWEGVDKDVTIGNWNRGRKKPSLKFFSERGHRQILATYYDSGNWQQGVQSWLTAAEGVPGIDGIMYTTWSNDYRHLEEFMQIVR